jgi:hypothetical protein
MGYIFISAPPCSALVTRSAYKLFTDKATNSKRSKTVLTCSTRMVEGYELPTTMLVITFPYELFSKKIILFVSRYIQTARYIGWCAG